jgi:hypothetical protein
MTFAIRLSNQPIWFQGGKEITYATEKDAELALIEEQEECERACKLGYMEDEGDFDNYRIVEVD